MSFSQTLSLTHKVNNTDIHHQLYRISTSDFIYLIFKQDQVDFFHMNIHQYRLNCQPYIFM